MRWWLGCLACVSAVAALEQPVLEPQTGHSGRVECVAYSPDGRLLASASDDCTIILWRVADGTVWRTLRGHTGIAYSVAFSPDGRTLASGGGEGVVRLWDVASGQRDGEPLRGHHNEVSAVAFSPDGTSIASAGYDRVVRLWDRVTHKPKGQPLKGHVGSIKGITFSPDSRFVASAGDDRTVRLWDVTTGLASGQPFLGHGGPVTTVLFSRDGQTLVSASADKTIRTWDVATGERKEARFAGHIHEVNGLALSPNGRTLASAGGFDDATVRLWDLSTGRALGPPLRCRTWGLFGVSFSPDGGTVAAAGSSGTIQLWNVLSGRLSASLSGQTSRVRSVAFSPDGRLIAAAGDHKGIRLWDVASGQPVGQPWQGHTNYVCSVAFAPDGRTAASGGADGTIRLWNVATGRPTHPPLEGHTTEVSAVAFSPDGRTLASASFDRTLRLWDLATGQPKGTPLRGHARWAHCVTFSPDGRTLASGASDHSVRLWDVATCQPIGKPLLGHEGAAAGLDFSPDGATLASGGNNTVRLWNPITGLQLGEPLSRHTAEITAVSFSKDGRTLASGSADRTIRLWDMRAADHRSCVLTGHTGAVLTLALSPDGRLLASADIEGAVRIWDVESHTTRAILYNLDDGADYLTVTPEGYYTGSLEGTRLVRWRINDQLYPADQFESTFHRPDLVAKALAGEPLPADAPVVNSAHTPPLVDLTTDAGAAELVGDRVKVRLVITPGAADAQIKRVELKLNGRAVDLSRAQDVAATGAGGATRSLSFGAKDFDVVAATPTADKQVVVTGSVQLQAGDETARLLASAWDEQDLRGDSQVVEVKRKPAEVVRPPLLFLLAVGVTKYQTPAYDLNYPHADAQDLAALFARQQGRAFGGVVTKTLTNADAKARSLRTWLAWLRTAPGPNDIAVLLFSGHGVRGPAGLYFCTHEADAAALKQTCVAWNEVDDALAKCRARQVVMLLDCCHAGAFGGQQASVDDLADRLVKRAGVMVIASSRGEETSKESPEWGHGAFTKAVLEGLGGQADPYKRGYVTVTALIDYVSARVEELTGQSQHPWLPRAEQFDTGLVLARTK